MLGSWYKQAGPKRDYNIINNYKILTPSNPGSIKDAPTPLEEDIKRKMKTAKSSKCTGECCLKIEDLGPFKVGLDMW